MKRFLILAWIAVFPALLFSQVSKQPVPKTKKMTITKYVYEKGDEKKYPDQEIKYDAKGNILEEIEYDEGTFVKHFIYVYDASDNKIKETEMDAAGKDKKTTEYKYDASNRRTEKLVYDAKNNLKSKRIYQYENW